MDWQRPILPPPPPSDGQPVRVKVKFGRVAAPGTDDSAHSEPAALATKGVPAPAKG